MKRELKPNPSTLVAEGSAINCKAYPDEKGIETKKEDATRHLPACYCKAYPDEKGIETSL